MNSKINNFKGDPTLGGFALPPDFPVCTFVTFKNAQLTLAKPSGTEVFGLGDLGPGTTISDLITSSADILSANFSAKYALSRSCTALGALGPGAAVDRNFT
jgi:hypothetical protein